MSTAVPVAVEKAIHQIDALITSDSRLASREGPKVLAALLAADVLKPVHRRAVETRRKRILATKPEPGIVERRARLELSHIRWKVLWKPYVVDAPDSPEPEPEPKPTISARAADREIGKRWFQPYAKTVEIEDRLRVRGTFEDPGNRYVLFRNGLQIMGTLRLGSGSRSIYVVLGDLRAKSIVLGDAVLVVTGRVRAKIVHKPNEGIFEVAGKQ